MASLISPTNRRLSFRSQDTGTSRLSPEAMIAIAFLLGSLVLGGNSADRAGINFLLEGLSLAVLLMTILLTGKLRPMSGSRGLTIIAIFLIIIYAVQLVPLPPQAWTALPGRELVVRGYELLNVPLPWRPLTFSPERTIASATALIPAFCALSLVLRTPREHFRALSYAIIAVSIISVLVGIAQIIGGQGSGLYWHNPRGGVSAHGFFANPNHLSTLLLVTMPLLFAVARTALSENPGHSKLILISLAATGLFLFFGILASQSTGGLVLVLPTLLASSLLLLKSPSPVRFSNGRVIVAAVAVLIAMSVPFALIMFGNQEISWGSSLGFGEFERLGIARTATAAIVEYWPFGSGMGTFPLVYPAHESLSSVSNVFINHAHNDYLELLFESGILGALLIAGVFAWWVRRTMTAWRAVDDLAPWAQAASLGLAIIAVHSGFDYPARTPALLALAAAFCAILGRSNVTRAVRASVPVDARQAKPSRTKLG